MRDETWDLLNYLPIYIYLYEIRGCLPDDPVHECHVHRADASAFQGRTAERPRNGSAAANRDDYRAESPRAIYNLIR